MMKLDDLILFDFHLVYSCTTLEHKSHDQRSRHSRHIDYYKSNLQFSTSTNTRSCFTFSTQIILSIDSGSDPDGSIQYYKGTSPTRRAALTRELYSITTSLRVIDSSSVTGAHFLKYTIRSAREKSQMTSPPTDRGGGGHTARCSRRQKRRSAAAAPAAALRVGCTDSGATSTDPPDPPDPPISCKCVHDRYIDDTKLT